ncbi:solute carrier family 41 member 1 isoform X1 [Anopheles darlingi]|uniref:solute carrier family 41 member 1 isoform X1 n=1 Tax=Anopheles darlingi TaxID=43151 RepID=UPI0021003BDB|nr:solute carrier family 41 member 1 isoform X1 [Anopheles darlingi]XP_049537673.1 solute carrier family 41 member 1 isoform X1 [Anopheles darlingi]XP_049537681.1 solute carrier family 41 member 1 isoform X1 [Anopheles darlingi]
METDGGSGSGRGEELQPPVTVAADGVVVVAIGDVVVVPKATGEGEEEGRRRSSTLTTITTTTTTTPGSPIPDDAIMLDDGVLLECQGPVPGFGTTGIAGSLPTTTTTAVDNVPPRRSSSTSGIPLQQRQRPSSPNPPFQPFSLQQPQKGADPASSLQIDMRGATEFYRVDEDDYRPFTITTGYNGDGTGKVGTGHQPLSSSGSLASIITTSITSSEADHRGGTISSVGTGSLAGLDEAEPVVVGAKGGGREGPRLARSCDAVGDGGGGGGGGGDGGDGVGPGNGGLDGHVGPGGDAGAVAGRAGTGGLRHEKWWQTTIQIAIPFFIAGIGTIGAGIILGRVEGRSSFGEDSTFISFLASHWKVFKHVTELFILVPALLGLKGNLDMCLASRLSTQANLGNMTSKRAILHMIVGNIALVQVQAIVAAFIVSIFAISVGAIMNGNFVFDHAMLLTAASMFTATTSCFVLDFVLVAVILLSNRYQMNPDNLATPLAASIGDVVSISLLSFIATQLFENIDTHLWITFAVVIAYFMLLPMWVFIVLRNTYTRTVLTSGWVPVLSALFISGMGGLVLDTAVGIFNGFVVFQPIINGIGGNLVSVQASKISTMLHQSSILGIIPPHINVVELPWKALFKGVPYAKTARILILMSIPGQVLFIFAADYIHMQRSTIGAPFVLSYLLVSTIQIMLLLYIAHVIIHLMWNWKIDPDNSAIPYLTALGDLLGSSFLMVAFLFLRSIGAPYGEEPDEQELVYGLLSSTTTPDGSGFGGDAFTASDLISGSSGI